jgi:peptidoglycan/xylan/chitin deacetylase (PgdA/CDA1 family)
VSCLALTFDDGPDERFTPRLLDVLGNAGARATFFPIGPRAQQRPNLIGRMVAEGHGVGVHCQEHVRHSARDQAWGRRDADRSLKCLREAGADPQLWRTPWGDLAPWTEPVAAERNLRIMGWDVDTHDWRGDAATDMFAVTRPGLVAGAVVLAHDGIGPGARRAGCEETLAYVRLVIEHARATGLTLEALT